VLTPSATRDRETFDALESFHRLRAPEQPVADLAGVERAAGLIREVLEVREEFLDLCCAKNCNASPPSSKPLSYGSMRRFVISAHAVTSRVAVAILPWLLSAKLGRYRIWAWGKNVSSEYYWTNVLPYGNAISRYVGQPATYGVSLSGRF
jgi:hypothetical protein